MLIAVATALVLHFIADFLLQSNDMAIRKSQEVKVLLQHVGIHLVVFFVGLVVLVGPLPAILVSLTNASFHAVIDWNIWRIFKRWAASKGLLATDIMANDSARHWFFVTIGFDQLLHALSIIAAIALFI